MLERERFSIRRFVSVMTLCTFLITGFSGLVLLLSHESHSSGGIFVNWKGMHEIVCIFFVIFGSWHFILNFKVLCVYFRGKDNKISFRMDWVIPVVLAIVFLPLFYLFLVNSMNFQNTIQKVFIKGVIAINYFTCLMIIY